MAGTEHNRAGSRPVTGSLVPRKDSHGTDVFRNDSGDCIVHSDLACYLQVTDFLETECYIKIHKLHPSCQGEDHYVGSWQERNICIIKGSSYRGGEGLDHRRESPFYKMHPQCCGGDHYGRANNRFFIIFQDQGVTRWVTDLRTAEGENNFDLHPDCHKGLYYFRIDQDLTLIRMDEKWGAHFYVYPDASKDKLDSFFSIHPDMLNFFPL